MQRAELLTDTRLKVEHLLSTYKSGAREALAPADNERLIEFIEALIAGEGVEEFFYDCEPPNTPERCLQAFALVAIVGELHRRLESRELESTSHG
jgi:hypothetical protein